VVCTGVCGTLSVGSIPIGYPNASVPERPNGGVCKTLDSLVQIQPDAPNIYRFSSVGLEHWPTKPRVGGSSPSGGTIKLFRCGVMAARRSPKPLVGVRFPPPEPNWSVSSKVEHTADNRETLDRYQY
jgi:hypothetical protein